MNATVSRYRLPLVLIGCGILLWAIVAQINHYLAPWHLNLFAGGLAITYPVLQMPHRHAWRVLLPLGLWIDAATPVPFGMFTILFFICYVVIHRFRARIARSDTVVGTIVAVSANAGIMLALSLAFAIRGPIPEGVFGSVLINLILSAALVALVAPWFFALQNRSLELVGINPQFAKTE